LRVAVLKVEYRALGDKLVTMNEVAKIFDASFASLPDSKLGHYESVGDMYSKVLSAPVLSFMIENAAEGVPEPHDVTNIAKTQTNKSFYEVRSRSFERFAFHN
jgi:hypothetical protein